MCTVKTALLSTLALASAEILVAPEDIPYECATICGPVVELADKCSLAPRDPEVEAETVARVKRRKVERRGGGDAHARLHDKVRERKRAVVTNAFGQVVSVPSGMDSGQPFIVTTVVTVTAEASPTADPGDQRSVTAPPANAETPSWTVMTTVMTMVAPEEGGSDDSLSLPADGAAPTTTTPLVVGNVADDDDDDALEYAETEEANDEVADLEKECVCENDSFDVELLSGLCSSCIWQTGFSLGSMENVMNQCNYSLKDYTPNSDSVADNLQVNAERPELPEGASVTLVNDSPPSPGLGTGFTGVLAAGAACGIALLF